MNVNVFGAGWFWGKTEVGKKVKEVVLIEGEKDSLEVKLHQANTMANVWKTSFDSLLANPKLITKWVKVASDGGVDTLIVYKEIPVVSIAEDSLVFDADSCLVIGPVSIGQDTLSLKVRETVFLNTFVDRDGKIYTDGSLSYQWYDLVYKRRLIS